MVPYGKPEPFIIGKVRAYCTGCKGGEFFRSRRFRRDKADTRICAKCGKEHLRSALLQQITDAVVAHADEVLKRSAETLKRKD